MFKPLATVRSAGLKALCLLSTLAYGQSTVKDCDTALLAKDYYSYAQSSHLQDDYLRVVTKEAWEQLKTTNGATFSYAGISAGDDYESLNTKREKYFESVGYHRNDQQALNILSIVTSER